MAGLNNASHALLSKGIEETFASCGPEVRCKARILITSVKRRKHGLAEHAEGNS